MKKMIAGAAVILSVLSACASGEESPSLTDEQLTERTRELEGVLASMGVTPSDAILFSENLLTFTTVGGCTADLHRVPVPPPGKDARSSERIITYYLQAHQRERSFEMFKVTPGDLRVRDDERLKPCLVEENK